MNIHQGIDQQLVTCTVEVATPIQEAFRDAELFIQLAFVRSTNLSDERIHLFVGGQHVGEHRQQLVTEISDAFLFDFKIEHTQELAVGASVGDDGFPAFVADQCGHRHAVVGVTTHDGVDAAHSAGHLEVNVHTIVADDHYNLRTFCAGFVHHQLHVFVLNSKGPVGHHVSRVGNRGVGEGLSDDGTRYSVHFFDDVGFEHLIAKVLRFDVLRHKVNFAREIFLDNFFNTVHAQSELPVTGHDIYTQQFAGIDHVLTVGPQAGT